MKQNFDLIRAITEAADAKLGLTGDYPLKSNQFVPTDATTANDVQNALDAAGERNDDTEEVETIAFGIEIEGGSYVKVMVRADQADDFETALADALGGDESVQELIDELKEKFDIIDVVYPTQDDDLGEFSALDADADSSEVANQSLGDVPPTGEKPARPIRESADVMTSGINQSVANMEPSSTDLESRFGNNKYIMFAVETMKALGIPPATIEFILRRQPSLVHDIRNRVMELGVTNMRRASMVLGFEFSELGKPTTMSMETDPDFADLDGAYAGAVRIIDRPAGDDADAELDVDSALPTDEYMGGDDDEDCPCKQINPSSDECQCDKIAVRMNGDELEIDVKDKMVLSLTLDEALALAGKFDVKKPMTLEHDRHVATFAPRGSGYVLNTSLTEGEVVMSASVVRKIREIL